MAAAADGGPSAWASDALSEANIHMLQSQNYVIIDSFIPTKDVVLAQTFIRESMRDELAKTRVGRGSETMAVPNSRGDLRSWVTATAIDAYSPGQGPDEADSRANRAETAYRSILCSLLHLQRLVSSRLPYTGVLLPTAERCEVQVTQYPGKGTRYVRHIDTFTDSASSGKTSGRRVTAIVYLNPDWCESDGGQLRIYRPSASGSETFMDVEPIAGRAIVFLSDRVPHEVLPAATDRWAISLWMHGRPPVGADLSAAATTTVSSTFGTEAATAHAVSGADEHDTVSSVGFVVPRAQWLDDSAAAAQHDGHVFIIIPAYRETEVHFTLQSVFEAARDPGRIRVGLFVQVSKADGDEVKMPHNHLITTEARDWAATCVRWMGCDSSEAAGPVWARSLCWSMWKGEPFVLGIDAHTRLVDGFDDQLIDQLLRAEAIQCREGGRSTANVVLSTYPAAYRWSKDVPSKEVLVQSNALELPTRMYCSQADDINQLPRFASRHWTPPGEGSADGITSKSSPEPIRSQGWAAGFTFSRSAMWQSVPPDAGLRFLFVGEEASTLIRLLSRGYQIFAPGLPLCLHRWERRGRPSFREYVTGWRTAQGIAARRAVRRLLFQALSQSDSTRLPWPGTEIVPPGGYSCEDCSSRCEYDGAEDIATLEEARGAVPARVKQWMNDAMIQVVGAEREIGGRYGLGPISCSKEMIEWGLLPLAEAAGGGSAELSTTVG